MDHSGAQADLRQPDLFGPGRDVPRLAGPEAEGAVIEDLSEAAAPNRVELRRIAPAQNMRRFYRMCLQPDLFGGVTLVREWGRIGSPGQILLNPHDSEAEAQRALARLMTQKERRGYARVAARAA